jgi:hypothetical protein
MDSEATDEAWRQWWLEYQVELEQASYKALLRVHENSANLDGCETCAKNEDITRRLMTAEDEPLHKENHITLREVYHNSGREQLARAERNLPGCERCCANVGISRRCMSPGIEGAPSDDMQRCDDVHAIEIGEEGIIFCKRCRGMDINVRHQPNWHQLPWTSLHAHKATQ